MKKALAALLALGMLASLAACQVTATLPDAAGDAAGSATDGGISTASPAPSSVPAATATPAPDAPVDEENLIRYLCFLSGSVYGGGALSASQLADPLFFACPQDAMATGDGQTVRLPVEVASQWCERLFGQPLDPAALAEPPADPYRLFLRWDEQAGELVARSFTDQLPSHMIDEGTLALAQDGDCLTATAQLLRCYGRGYALPCGQVTYTLGLAWDDAGRQYYPLRGVQAEPPFPTAEELGAAGLVADCAAFFADSGLCATLASPCTLPADFADSSRRATLMFSVESLLIHLSEQNGWELLRNESQELLFPDELWQDATWQLLGCTFDRAGDGSGFSTLGGHGYGTIRSEPLPGESYLEDGEIHLVVQQYFCDYGADPEPAGRLDCRFQYLPDQFLCPYRLCAVEELPPE